MVGYGTSPPPARDEAELRSFFVQYPVLQGKRLALFMGRIHPKKGCDMAIEAFARVLAADPQWHLVIAGPDQVGLRPSLSSLGAKLGVSDRITWTGMIGGAAKRGVLCAAEVLVLPSHQENFGIVVAEAMSYGVPPLISNKVNIWREIRDDGAGIVAADDLDGTCSLLTSWLSQSDHEKELMRDRARQSFARRFEIRRGCPQPDSRPRGCTMHSAHPRSQGDPYLVAPFSFGDKLRRAIWTGAYVLLFRTSPRPFHGWRRMLLRLFGAQIGPNVRIYPTARIWAPWNLICDEASAVAEDAIIYNPCHPCIWDLTPSSRSRLTSAGPRTITKTRRSRCTLIPFSSAPTRGYARGPPCSRA